MSREKRVARRISRRRRLRPGRHTLARQSAAVLALGLGLAVGSPAQAKIIYTDLGPGGKTISGSGSYTFGFTDSGLDYFIIHFTYYSNSYGYSDAYGSIEGAHGYSYVAIDASGYAARLSQGDQIGPNLTGWNQYPKLGSRVSNNGPPTVKGPWPGQTGYLGLKFYAVDPYNGKVSTPNYGWAKISWSPNSGQLTIYGYAYEDVRGQAILAGAGARPRAVPVPSLLLLLGTGAVGMLAYRRQRRA
jgi:hypothetical protein